MAGSGRWRKRAAGASRKNGREREALDPAIKRKCRTDGEARRARRGQQLLLAEEEGSL